MLLGAALALVSARAEAGVEVTTALTVGGGARVVQMEGAASTAGLFTMALRADMLFGRAGPRHFAAGPFLSLRTDGFWNFAPALGASLLLPLTEPCPLVISAGGVLRVDGMGVAGGVLERLWFGARSYNYHSVYALAIGVFVESRQFFDQGGTVDVVGGVDLDLEVFAIPLMALWSLMFRRGQ